MRYRYAMCYALVAFATGVLATGCQNTSGVNALSSAQTSSAQPDKTSKSYWYPPEVWNGFVTPPGTGPSPTDFEIIFAGNVTGDIPNPPEPGYGVYDPFCPPSQTCSNINVSYSSSSNTTTVEFYGPTLYQNIPNHGNEVHFGLLNGPGGSDVKCFKWYTEWTFTSAPPQVTPVLNVCNTKKVKTKPAAAAPTVFATVFVETSFSPITSSSPATSGTWVDVAYSQLKGTTQPKFEFTNPTSQTIYTANSGIVLNQKYPTDSKCVQELDCSENIANLKLLNYQGMPPPGSPSSPFVKMQNPPPSMIPPAGH
jgi:hypothetical protein